jgi:signal peptide peptidase SppA
MPKTNEDNQEQFCYPNIMVAVTSAVWGIMPEKLREILEFVNLKATGGTVPGRAIEKLAGKRPKFRDIRGNIAILPLYGTISQRMNMMSAFSGGTSTELFGRALDDALADETVGAIVLDVDSPGGTLYGVPELAEKIFRARGKKPIIAAVNSLCASAAFWLASAADEIVITPSGDIGSVGVYAVHTDISKAEEAAGIKTTIVSAGKYKVEGNPHEPLNDEGRKAIEVRVNEFYDMFVADLAGNRDVPESKVRDGFGEGRIVGAKQAVAEKMADRIATLEQVILQLQGNQSKKGKMAAQVEIEKLR